MKKTRIIFAIAIPLFIASCGTENPPAQQTPGAIPVSVQQVNHTYAPYYEEVPATVKALLEVELRPQVSGYITGIHFKEGEQVKKGQKLYSIDQQQTEANYLQARANLSVQKANLEKALKDVERYRELDKSDAIAKQQVDYAEANYQAAQKQVEAAEAAVQSAQTNVRYSSIVAPFNGTIGISSVRLGASVVPGQTLLNTISSDDPIGVDIVVDQSRIFEFSKLLNKESARDSTFLLSIGDFNYPYPGRLSFIDRAVDPQTGAIKIRLEFPNPEHTLRAGMSGGLRILTNTESKSITIPFKSVTEQLGEFFVYVVTDKNTVTQRQVLLEKQVGKDIIIKKGLSQNETIVVEGVQNLREGASVQYTSPQAISQR
ncbi:MAG: efflux RND transporter periplasmic adaptor subunit [Cyclobacteriaceae bacterium]